MCASEADSLVILLHSDGDKVDKICCELNKEWNVLPFGIDTCLIEYL